MDLHWIKFVTQETFTNRGLPGRRARLHRNGADSGRSGSSSRASPPVLETEFKNELRSAPGGGNARKKKAAVSR
jgi:hypothetical protein